MREKVIEKKEERERINESKLGTEQGLEKGERGKADKRITEKVTSRKEKKEGEVI